MKRTFGFLSALAAAAFTLASCEEELIPSKDTYGDYKGETGTFAYIVGGTTPDYEAVSVEIQHTPVGELGTIERNFEVAVTKAQAEDVTVTVEVDNSAVTGSYSVFPDGVLKYQSTVTIPAGELKADFSATVDNADFAKLTDPSYMAVFRITDATGVQISSNSNEALLYVQTVTIDPTTNIVSMAGETATYSVKNYTDNQTGDDISRTINITGTDEAFAEFTVEMTVDNSLIASYNEENGTSYIAVPDGLVKLTDAVMAKDAKSATASVSISETDRAQLTDGNGYLIPVRIESASPATLSETSGVLYMVINVTNFDYASDMFSALYLGNKEMASWYKFKEGIDVTEGFLYVFHMFIDENVGQQRVGNIADKDEYWINMLRLGQKNNGEELEWWVGPNNNRKFLYADVSAGEWHQIALYYDGNNYVFYVDKVEASRYELTEDDKEKNSSVTFQAIEFANSWGDSYRSPFKGRLWNFSVWQNVSSNFLETVLDASYRGMEDWVIDYASWYGLKAYWPMDEGSGYILNDRCGWENIDMSNMTRCNDEVNFVPFDASPYVQWIADEHNMFIE